MKWVLGAIIVLTLGQFVGMWLWIDLPTALLGLVAWSVICACAGAPVVFSVLTRRNDLRRLSMEEAEEIRLRALDQTPRTDRE